MPVGKRVRVVGVVLHAHAGGVVVDQEEGRQPLAALQDDAVEDHEVGVVRTRDEPLLAVEHPLAGGAVKNRRRGEVAGVGARGVLGDRVAAGALAAQTRIEVPPPLLRVAMDQRVVATRNVRPQTARHLPELLVDEHLLEHAPALAAELLRERAAVQVRLDRRATEVVAPVAGHTPVGALELDFARLQDVTDEPPGTVLELELGRRQRQVHGAAEDGPLVATREPASR